MEEITGVAGTCYLTDFAGLPASYVECASFAKVRADKTALPEPAASRWTTRTLSRASRGAKNNRSGIWCRTSRRRRSPGGAGRRAFLYAPISLYEALGGVPAIEEVEFPSSITAAASAAVISAPSSSIRGAGSPRAARTAWCARPSHDACAGFQGYIHDVGGPTANFRLPSCKEQMKNRDVRGRQALPAQPCGKIIVDHREYLGILPGCALPGVKKVFIRSGIRYDYLIRDKDESFFKELVEHRVSGQLKVAPEHCAPDTLRYMGKPPIEVYNKFSKRFYELTKQAGKETISGALPDEQPSGKYTAGRGDAG